MEKQKGPPFEQKIITAKHNPLGWILVALLCLTFYITNPTEAHFKTYREDAQKNAGQQDNKLTGSIMELIASPTGNLTEQTTERTDLYILSFYTVTSSEGNQYYLGMLNNFVRVG